MAPWRSPPVVAALLVGLVVGAVVGVTALAPADTTPPPDPENPPWSYSSGTGCVPDATVGSGWLVATTLDDARAVTFNLTVAHDADEEVTVDLRRSAPGDYVVEVETVETTEEKPDPPADCIHGSTLQGGVSLPVDYDEVEVVYGGTTLRTVENDDSTAVRHWTFDLPTAASN
jgi:hypothetical protein